MSALLLAAVFGIIDNSALECGSTSPTFYPRGDRWVTQTNTAGATPWQPAPIYYQIYSGGSDDISTDAEKQAVERASNTWNAASCAGQAPSIQIRRNPTDYSSRDDGDVGGYRNVIYWVETSDDWRGDSQTIALTTNQRTEDTGFTVTSDMVFNGHNFRFRARGNDSQMSGCTASGTTASTCFDVEAVAVHEFGHFLGFNHVQCTDAVMYPSGSTTGQRTTLSENEVAGICAVYPPRSQTEPKATVGELCQNTAACATGLVCAMSPGGTVGWCAESCTTTSSCDPGYVCRTTGLGVKFCGPGVNQSGDPGTDPGTGPSPDLCRPCSGAADCANGLCVSDGTQQLCSDSCSTTDPDVAACPSGMTCQATDQGHGVCWPSSAGSCGTADTRRDLGELCYDELADQIYECGSGLVCFVFKPRVEGQVGACVTACDNAGAPCPDSNQTCCFGFDNAGGCLPFAADRPFGGCFDIRREGQSCFDAEHTCEAGTECFNFNASNAFDATCFAYCTADSCATDEYCVEWGLGGGAGFVNLCCDQAAFDADPTRCVANPDADIYDVGVECNVNADCDSNLCLKYDNTAACSRSCDPYTGFGCPGNIDVNGDGSADGGFRCMLVSGGEGRCWPLDGPAAPPGGRETPPTVDEGGCGCGAVTPVEGLGMVVLVMMRRWRRRRG